MTIGCHNEKTRLHFSSSFIFFQFPMYNTLSFGRINCFQGSHKHIFYVFPVTLIWKALWSCHCLDNLCSSINLNSGCVCFCRQPSFNPQAVRHGPLSTPSTCFNLHCITFRQCHPIET